MDKGKLKGHVALWVANIIWGLNAPIGKSVLISATNPGGISPFAMSVYRMIGAALLFWTASLFLPRERVTRRDIVLLFFASLFGIPAQPDAFPLGAVAHIAHRHLDHRHDRPRAHDDPRHASSCANPSPGSRPGAYSSAAPEAVLLILVSQHGSGHTSSVKGDVLCIISAVSYATYLTAFRDVIVRYSPVTVMKWMFLFAAIVAVAIYYRPLVEVELRSSLVPHLGRNRPSWSSGPRSSPT